MIGRRARHPQPSPAGQRRKLRLWALPGLTTNRRRKACATEPAPRLGTAIMLFALGFAAADDAAAFEIAEQGGDHRPLSTVVVAIDDDPIVRRPQFVSPGGVRIQSRVVASIAVRMK